MEINLKPVSENVKRKMHVLQLKSVEPPEHYAEDRIYYVANYISNLLN